MSIKASQLSPGSWSPDGRRLVYDAAVDGNNDIYVVDIEGGKPKRLTQEASLDGVASRGHTMDVGSITRPRARAQYPTSGESQRKEASQSESPITAEYIPRNRRMEGTYITRIGRAMVKSEKPN